MTSLNRKHDPLFDNPQETKQRSLMLCFTVLDHDGNFPIFYKFEFYPIEKFITKPGTCGKLELDPYFTWEEEMDNAWEEELDKEWEELLKSNDGPFWCKRMEVSLPKPHRRTRAPPYCDMRLLNLGDLVYAVGGHRIDLLQWL